MGTGENRYCYLITKSIARGEVTVYPYFHFTVLVV